MSCSKNSYHYVVIGFLLTFFLPLSAYGQCPPTGAFCSIDPVEVDPGDLFKISMEVCNNDPENDLDVCVIAVMEAYGHYSFHPFWDPGRLNTQVTIPACSCIDITIVNFVWQTALSGQGSVITGLLDCDSWMLVGEYSACPYAW